MFGTAPAGSLKPLQRFLSKACHASFTLASKGREIIFADHPEL